MVLRIVRLFVSLWRSSARRRTLGAVTLTLLVLVASQLIPAVAEGVQRYLPPPVLLNPCTGEAIVLRDTAHLLSHVTPDQAGTRELGVNAVGVSGVGSQGTYYLPIGSGKVVLTLANGTLDFALWGDLELIGRGNQSQDFLSKGIAHLRLSHTSGLSGSDLAVRMQCR